MLLHEVLQSVERRLNRRTDAPPFDIGVGNLVENSELVDQALRIGLGIGGLEEVVRAGEDAIDSAF